MEICDLAYHRPATVAEACTLARRLEDARFLAGGTELLVLLKQGRAQACHLIALDAIPELRIIRDGRTHLHIGALATLSEVAESPAVNAAFPALVEAIGTMAAVQIRNRATIGGNFCAAVPCADTAPICIVSQAKLRVVGPDGERTVPAESFFVGPRQTVLEPGELLVEILVPHPPAGSGASYQRFGRRHAMTLAVAGVAVRLVIEHDRIIDGRVALASVAPMPLWAEAVGKAMVGQAPSDAVFADIARQAAAAARPITDVRGTVDFRRSLVETLTLRALETARARVG